MIRGIGILGMDGANGSLVEQGVDLNLCLLVVPQPKICVSPS
jgi:hypothetical protein